MRLRMYLRGLGIGILVAAFLMGIGGMKNGEMSDAQIISRARELGMVEEDSVLKPVSNETDNNTTVETAMTDVSKADSQSERITADDGTATEIASKNEEKDETPAENDKADNASDTDESDEEALNDTESEIDVTDNAETVDAENDDEQMEGEMTEADVPPQGITTESFKLSIANGASSDTVAKLLERGGLVSSASDFDAYLCRNNYDHRIAAGEYDIPADADYETIAKLISR